MRRLLAVFVAAACILGVGSAAWARVIRVSPSPWSVWNGPGDNWANAYFTIGGALNVALPGDELWVHGRVYEEYVTIPSGVAVYGGFDGTEHALSQRPAFPRPSPDYNTTIIAGEYIN